MRRMFSYSVPWVLLANLSFGVEVAEPHHNLGYAFYTAGAYEKAIKEFEEALRIKPDLADSHLFMGWSLEQAGRRKEAIHALETFLKLRPNDPYAADTLKRAENLHWLGKFEGKAIGRWRRMPVQLRIFIHPGKDMVGFHERMPSLVVSALEEWCLSSGGRISFVRIYSVELSDIQVSWTSTWLVLDGHQVGGLAKRQYKGAEITSAEIILPTSYAYPHHSLSDKDFLSTALHEWGHALGLEHSSDPQDIMYSNSRRAGKLSLQDRSRIRELYAD